MAQRPPSSRFILICGLAIAALAATGAPTPEAVALTEGWGLPRPLALAAIYGGVVVLGMALIAATRALLAGQPRLVRFVGYAVAGFAFGFGLAQALELFAGFEAGASALLGPLKPPGWAEIAGLATASLLFFLAALVGAIWAIGAPAARAMLDAPDDDACAEISAHERPNFLPSFLGSLLYAISLAALTLAQLLAAPPPSPAHNLLAAIAAAAALASWWPSWVIWARADELERRRIIDSYAIAAIFMTVLLFVWALLNGIGWAAPLTAYGALVIFFAAQTVAALAAGGASGALFAQAPKAAAKAL
jgi:hypothetical protein